MANGRAPRVPSMFEVVMAAMALSGAENPEALAARAAAAGVEPPDPETGDIGSSLGEVLSAQTAGGPLVDTPAGPRFQGAQTPPLVSPSDSFLQQVEEAQERKFMQPEESLLAPIFELLRGTPGENFGNNILPQNLNLPGSQPTGTPGLERVAGRQQGIPPGAGRPQSQEVATATTTSPVVQPAPQPPPPAPRPPTTESAQGQALQQPSEEDAQLEALFTALRALRVPQQNPIIPPPPPRGGGNFTNIAVPTILSQLAGANQPQALPTLGQLIRGGV